MDISFLPIAVTFLLAIAVVLRAVEKIKKDAKAKKYYKKWSGAYTLIEKDSYIDTWQFSITDKYVHILHTTDNNTFKALVLVNSQEGVNLFPEVRTSSKGWPEGCDKVRISYLENEQVRIHFNDIHTLVFKKQ